MSSTATEIAISTIRLDGGTQSRAQIDTETVDAYHADMLAGSEFPPVTVFYDGTEHWMADGFHRLAARQKTKLGIIKADVRQGSRRDAILFSVGANSKNGLRRTNADKRRAVETLLNDEEWSAWSNGQIAKQCGVSEFLVRKARPSSIKSKMETPVPRKVERNGKTFEMDTANIGKTKSTPDHDVSCFDPEEEARTRAIAEASAPATEPASDATNAAPAPDINERARATQIAKEAAQNARNLKRTLESFYRMSRKVPPSSLPAPIIKDLTSALERVESPVENAIAIIEESE